MLNRYRIKRFFLLWFLCFFLINTLLVSANPHTTVIHLQIGSNKAWINEKEYSLDLAPFLHQQRTMVPLRFISEAFGASIEWLPNPKISGEGMIIIDFPHEAKRIKLHTRVLLVFVETFSSTVPEPSVKTYTLDVAPYVVKPQNRSVVPLRFISEVIGATVEWNETHRSITVSYTR
jgi:aromatic ring-cleaving dioxygenase